ncbi:MAG: hypothetical protein BWY06_02911 [Candidatus Latescibacteria bacterium ADurb.Bin168]|nr:MAG: hypothetical protein BWY06_02911 [Candidatus Latescibacteria bacterium ADurb.Bin168]
MIILLPFVLDYFFKANFFTNRLGAGAGNVSSSLLLFTPAYKGRIHRMAAVQATDNPALVGYPVSIYCFLSPSENGNKTRRRKGFVVPLFVAFVVDLLLQTFVKCPSW